MLAGAGPALVEHPLAHRLEQRHQSIDGRSVAANHDGQGGVACADVSARHGRIHAVRAMRTRRLVDLLRQRRFGRGHVDEDLSRPWGRERSVCAEIDLTHVGREADDREDDVRLLADPLRCVRPDRAVLDSPSALGFRWC
jgi:hypothetical protein